MFLHPTGDPTHHDFRFCSSGVIIWWTEDIAKLRRECINARRLASRARNRPDAAAKNAVFKGAQKQLRKAIKQSKVRCWVELCREVDMDPWGLGYKIVTRKLGLFGPPELLDAPTTERVIEELFPVHPPRRIRTYDVPVHAIPLFTEEKLIVAAKSLKKGRAPGPNGIPAEVLQVIALRCPAVLLQIYNACLTVGIFCTL